MPPSESNQTPEIAVVDGAGAGLCRRLKIEFDWKKMGFGDF